MNFNTWVNFFQFVKEMLSHPSLAKVRTKENRARNLYTLSFLGMFIFAMIMTEQAVLYSTAKYNQVGIITDLQKEVALCEASLPYYETDVEKEGVGSDGSLE